MRAEGIFGQAVDRIGGQPITARMARKAPIRHLDPTLLFTTLALAAFGSLMVYSATAGKLERAGVDPATFLKRQLVFLVAGAVVLIGVSFFDYRHFRGFAPLIYGFTIVTLLAVLSFGDTVAGAKRWITFGFFHMQPSELAKVAVIMAVAALIAERKGEMRARDVTIVCAVVGLPAGLIFLQPDLGTMMVFVFLTAAMLLLGGAKIRHFVMLGLIALVSIFAAFQAGLVKDYQVDRLTAFLDSTPDRRSEGYNLIQSKIAIASGGLRGRGLQAENTQTSLEYVPEQHTDFIFTAVGEQLGFMGSATLLGLFAFLIWRALRIAAMSRDMFGTLLAGGIAALWAFQVFVNVGMTMGMMPITGIPLPFLSYGGTSLLTNFIAVGLLLNVHMRRFL
jgi:rod shape determining protein RodA